MKKISMLIICSSILFLFQACFKDKLTHTYSILVPVYKSKTEVYANIKSNQPREIQSPGKIFLYGHYIFLNEIDKGVHVIDNSDPAHPVIKAFIDIPGNMEIAVKGNTLYADIYKDLVAVDISDPMQARFIKYVPNVFPQRYYPNGFIADSNRVIVDWIKRDTTVAFGPTRFILYSALSSSGAAAGPSAVPVTGIAGSMARFAIVNNYLYGVNQSQLSTFDISNANNPQRVVTNNIGWNIETIYPFKDKLFIGSNAGMFIYDITNPATPQRLAQFSHARACDPVIADDNNAYITLRDGTTCGGFNNQLDVVNITNLVAPSFVKTYPMTNPHGLAKDNNLLFICDGRDGLKMYDATDPANIILKKQVTGFETYDAIAWNNTLLVVAKDGLYQYDYSNPFNLVQRSRLGINR